MILTFFLGFSLIFISEYLKRRERDSNPRRLSPQRFSRPPQSTTLPSLLGILRTCRSPFPTAKVILIFYYANIFAVFLKNIFYLVLGAWGFLEVLKLDFYGTMVTTHDVGMDFSGIKAFT